MRAHRCIEDETTWGSEKLSLIKLTMDRYKKNKKEGIHLQLVLAAGRTLSIALLTSYTLAFITTIICVIHMCWYGGPDNL